MQRISIAPKFCIEFNFFTTVLYFAILTAPFARFVVTSIGSISGVNPTATDIENNKACSQSPFVIPLITKTIGIIIIINFIRSILTEFTPLSKLVISLSSVIVSAILPNTVSFPVDNTIAVAVPLVTLVPINAKFSNSKWLSISLFLVSFESFENFSTTSDSPVIEDSLINKSFEEMILTSAGIISPALSFIISPTTISSIGISLSFPSRITADVVFIISLSFSPALFDFPS